MGSSRQPALSWDYPRTSPPSIGINRAGHIVREVGRQELDHPDTILDDSERCRRDLCWNLIGGLRSDEDTWSGSKVNRLIGEFLGQAVPSVHFAHSDLT
jgi:hypothetical protein